MSERNRTFLRDKKTAAVAMYLLAGAAFACSSQNAPKEEMSRRALDPNKISNPNAEKAITLKPLTQSGSAAAANGHSEASPSANQKEVSVEAAKKLQCQTPGIARAAFPRKLNRLTNFQFKQSLADLIPNSVLQNSIVVSKLGGIPTDEAVKGFDSEQPLFSLQQSEAIFNVAVEISDNLATDSGAMQSFLSMHGVSCNLATPADGSTCAGKIADIVGAKAYRHPVSTAQKAVLTKVADSAKSAGVAAPYIVSATLAGILTNKEFTFAVESSSNGKLDQYSVASRLALEITGSLPDKQLSDYAKNGKLSDATLFKSEVVRLLDSDKGHARMRHFAKQWTNHNAIQPSGGGDSAVAAAGGAPALKAAVENELASVVESVVYAKDNKFSDMFQTRKVLPANPFLASQYGVSQGTQLVDTPDSKRVGIHTRLGMLFGRDAETSPPHRGYYYRVMMLCGSIGKIPDKIDKTIPAGAPDVMSGRQRWERLTGQPACVGCHSKMNPLGFALESFDSMGRVRSNETVLNSKTNAKVSVDINDMVDIAFNDTENHSVQGAQGLGDALGNSEQAQMCFATRLAQAQNGFMNSENCVVKDMFDTLSSAKPGSLREALLAYYLSPEFQMAANVSASVPN